MKFWVGVTDSGWYKFLADQQHGEANFWQPSSSPPFVRAPLGMPFLFKLKRPYSHIAGGGYFVNFSTFPLSMAWEIFGTENGAATLDDLREMLRPYARGVSLNHSIGCTTLSNVFYLPEDKWFVPRAWSGNIVRGKSYDTDQEDGAWIWEEVTRAAGWSFVQDDVTSSGMADKYGKPQMVKPRLGQSSFRVLVTDAYKRTCAITGEHTLVALEAAHIVPYSALNGTHEVRNGLLLRADFHKLYDAGLVGVTQDLKIKVSPRIREEYFNGKAYYRLDGSAVSHLPDRAELRPDPDRLAWHHAQYFQA